MLVWMPFLLIGCSTPLSSNFTSKSELSLKGGVFQKKEWQEELKFKRYSWFQDVTMLHDLLLVKSGEMGPFSQWFNAYESKMANSCQEFYVALSYALDPKKLSQRMLLSNLSEHGFEKVLLSHFENHIRLHPRFVAHSLHLYSVYGLCRKSGNSKNEGTQVFVDFPGFKRLAL